MLCWSYNIHEKLPIRLLNKKRQNAIIIKESTAKLNCCDVCVMLNIYAFCSILEVTVI